MNEARISRKRFIRIGAALGLGSVGASMLVGCGGSSGSSEMTIPSPDPNATGPAEGLSGPEIEPGQPIAAEDEVEPNSAIPYTNAATGQEEVLVRLQDGEFVAYSAICTH